MIQNIVSLLYFFLPAYFANMTPPFLKKLNLFSFLARPIDGNKTFKGKPILGSHKTWRGAIFSFLVVFFVCFFQFLLFSFPFFQKISLVDYSRFFLKISFLMGLGTISGDLFFAFLKRRLNLPPGAPFLPFDQTNYVIGNFIFLEPFFSFGFFFWLELFVLTFFLHAIFNRLGYLLKIHNAKW
jgi:CDP-2,3-bis-(O-geranylgeranyl)-sn-glycerol synthase